MVYWWLLTDGHSGYINHELAITNDGKEAAQSPVDPMWAYAVELAKRHRPLVAQHIVAMAILRCSMHPIWSIPSSHLAVGHLAMTHFADPMSDHLTELNALYAYEAIEDTCDSQRTINEWCNMRFLNRRVLDEVISIRNMCVDRMHIHTSLDTMTEQTRLDIRWVLARAFFRHCAFLTPRDGDEYPRYRTIHGNWETVLAVDSMLNSLTHQWVIYDKFKLGQLPYLEKATAIDPAWIVVSWLVSRVRHIFNRATY